MTLSRRNFIASTIGASAAASFGAKAQSLSLRMITDRQFEAANYLALYGEMQGAKVLDPQGEMVRFLKSDMKHWRHDQPVIGFTSHADFQILNAFVGKNGGAVSFAGLAGPKRRQTLSGALAAVSSETRPTLVALLDIQHAANRTGVAWLVRSGQQGGASKRLVA